MQGFDFAGAQELGGPGQQARRPTTGPGCSAHGAPACLWPPPAGDGRGVDVYKLVQSLHEQGLRMPVLLRFLDIIGDRIERLNVGGEGGVIRRARLSAPYPHAAASPLQHRHASGRGCVACLSSQPRLGTHSWSLCSSAGCVQAAFNAAIARFEYQVSPGEAGSCIYCVLGCAPSKKSYAFP